MAMDIHRNNAFSSVAMEAAFNEGEEWLEQLLPYLEANFDFIRQYCEAHIDVYKRQPIILPRRFMLTIVPTALAMDTNTMGTTMVNIRFRKISPNGASTFAFSPRTIPSTAPIAIPDNKMIGKR